MEHRWYARKTTGTAVGIYLQGSWAGRGKLRDCSCMGAYVEGSPDVCEGQAISLKVQGNHAHYEAPWLSAIVVHREKTGFGVMFVERDDVLCDFTNRQESQNES